MLIWIVFAVLTAAVIAGLLWPLSGARKNAAANRADYDLSIYRDQLSELERDEAAGQIGAEEAKAARNELSRRMLEAESQNEPAAPADRGARTGAALAAVIGIPGVAMAIYLATGHPGLPDVPRKERLAKAIENNDVAALIARTEAILAKNPDDLRGWYALGITKRRLRDYAGAAVAFKRVVELSPDNPGILTDYAEIEVLANQGTVTEAARAALDKAIILVDKNLQELQSRHLEAVRKKDSMTTKTLEAEIGGMRTARAKVRFYRALADSQQGRKEEALAAFQAMLKEAPEKAPWRAAIQRQIARLDRSASAPALSRDQVEASKDMTAGDRQAMIRGMVQRLADRLAEDGSDIDGWLRLANARAVLGEKKKAAAALSKAAERFKNDSAALARIAKARARLGISSQ